MALAAERSFVMAVKEAKDIIAGACHQGFP